MGGVNVPLFVNGRSVRLCVKGLLRSSCRAVVHVQSPFSAV
jgi:hypothetical protein